MEQLVDDVAPDTELIPPAPGGALPGPFRLTRRGRALLPIFRSRHSKKGRAAAVTNTGEIEQNQKITNTDYGYRFPYVESKAQNERAQISLMDQQFGSSCTARNFRILSRYSKTN